MAIPTRATSHGTFFITTQTYNRKRLFQVEATALLFLETLRHYRHQGHYKLHTFVLMPNHPQTTPHSSTRIFAQMIIILIILILLVGGGGYYAGPGYGYYGGGIVDLILVLLLLYFLFGRGRRI